MKRLIALFAALALFVSLAAPAVAADGISIVFDGHQMYPRRFSGETEPTVAQKVNDRTMIPIRFLAEAIGGTVEWSEETQQVTITRAGTVIVMTIGSQIALVNDEAFEMDVAPYLYNGRTYLPARFVAEFLGQLVEWDEGSQTVYISEDKSVARDSNIEQWALAMGAMLVHLNSGDPTIFGGNQRFRAVNDSLHYFERNSSLSVLTGSQWGVESREDFIETVYSILLYGHNSYFAEYIDLIYSYYEQGMLDMFLDSVSDEDYVMFVYTYALYEKWGELGIVCWDLFRVSNLAQWGYTAGYITYWEALALIEPAAAMISEYFDSWDMAYENYLDGYLWWSQNPTDDVWSSSRALEYLEMKSDEDTTHIFDDTLFETGVIRLEFDENGAPLNAESDEGSAD